MADGNKDIFGEITRIEKQADAAIAEAEAKAKLVREEAERKAAELAAETDRQIERARTELAAEFEAKTGRVLTHIDVEFLKGEEALEDIREKRLDELVKWTASQITERQIHQETNGN